MNLKPVRFLYLCISAVMLGSATWRTSGDYKSILKPSSATKPAPFRPIPKERLTQRIRFFHWQMEVKGREGASPRPPPPGEQR